MAKKILQTLIDNTYTLSRVVIRERFRFRCTAVGAETVHNESFIKERENVSAFVTCERKVLFFSSLKNTF